MSIASIESVEPSRYREVLGRVPTSVAIIAAISDGTPVGVSVGSFTSVSLTPPLVGFYIAHTSSTWPHIGRVGRFCVNVLGDEQETLGRQFAVSGGDKFAGVGYRLTEGGTPVLDGVTAWIECDLERVVEAGDHMLVLGAVRDLGCKHNMSPLVFLGGAFPRLTAPSGVTEHAH
ncbi:flavin reductase family protein [Rhodococcus sp. NM-2]|uniref:flavin reductase family protein n=1 Tax=Rhodococcus sp. NM-2 TaxID=3401174 RepID=UPI003AAADF43